MTRRLKLALLAFALLLAACGAASQEATPLPAVETGVDPEAWALVPAGAFLYGQNDHETLVDYDYEIMVTDVTNAQYAAYLNAALAGGTVQAITGADGLEQVVGPYPGDEFHGYKHEVEITPGDWPHLWLDAEGLRLSWMVLEDGAGGYDVTALGEYAGHPMVMVTWFGARAYCEYYGGRLPTEIEWEKAARGTDGRPYPWGSEVARNNANFYSSHDVFEKLAGLGDTTPVGFYNGLTYAGYATLDSASPYGLYDMAGNVWQWTADIHEGSHYRYLRGGSRADYAYNLRVWTRNSAGPTYASPNVGFRCVRNP